MEEEGERVMMEEKKGRRKKERKKKGRKEKEGENKNGEMMYPSTKKGRKGVYLHCVHVLCVRAVVYV